MALRTAASVATRTRAIELLEEAVTVLAGSPARREQAAARVDLGTALRRANRRSDARAPLREGLQLARDWTRPRSSSARRQSCTPPARERGT